MAVTEALDANLRGDDPGAAGEAMELPDGFVAAPKPAAAKAVEAGAKAAGPTKKAKETKGAAETWAVKKESPAAKAAPEAEFTAAELRAMGHGAADLKRMLKDGTIVRASFGWYRFVRGA